MHDIIGSAGMLRGWVAVWTMQMLWLFASLTVAVGLVGVVETLISARRERRAFKMRPLAPDLVRDYKSTPLA